MYSKIRFCIRRLRLLVLHLLGKDLMILPTRKEVIVEFGNASYGQWGVAKEYLDKDSVILSFGIGMESSILLCSPRPAKAFTGLRLPLIR